MMQQTLKTLGCVISTALVIASSGVAYAADKADDRYWYIGGAAGVVDPVAHQFKHKESGTKITLKRSHLYTGNIGYSFYPNMIVEISGSYQPLYRMGYVLPERKVMGMTVPKTPGGTKVSAQIYTLNLIYKLNEVVAGIEPYLNAGVGFGIVKVKKTSSSITLPFSIGGSNQLEAFKVRNTTTRLPVWQVGGGLAKDISKNFSVDISAKLQVARNVKINYDTIDVSQGINFDQNGKVTNPFVAASPIKKTLGVGELTIGFEYRFPL